MGKPGEESEEFQGSYLVGLQWANDKGDDATTSEDQIAARGTLQTVLTRFQEQARGDEKYYDRKFCWVSAELVKGSHIGRVDIDRRDWGKYTAGDDESDLNEEDDECQLLEDEVDNIPSLQSLGSGSTRQHSTTSVSKPEGAGKFRPASDVLNRLRWDPGLDSNDYIVGYDDRFLGVQEKSLESWKSEQTDEEFIPQHRILYFKRRSDGKIMWERKTRTDEIFGSWIVSNGSGGGS
jgi:uncharacterized protein (UPF0248 family)